MFSLMLMASLAAVAAEAGPQAEAPKSEPATSIERALVERACGTPYTPWAEDEAQECFSAHLLSLRTDFGRDLSKLPAADRKSMDAACSNLRRPEQQDAYVDCLSARLVVLHDRRHPQRGNAPDSAVAASLVPASPDAGEMPAGQTSAWLRPATAGAILTGVIATGGLAFLVMRPRRTRRTCRVCGVEAPGADLCAACRHEAAEAVKRDAAERIQNERLQEAKLRPEPVAEPAPYEISERPDLAALDASAAEEHPIEPADVRADARSKRPPDDRVEPAGNGGVEKTVPEAATEPVFDPYVVLGVPPDAAPDAIDTAYQLARKRYDPEQVSFLGYEAQESFRLKAESVERAYMMLASM